ncbi:hypothetical protein OH76DRAFT_1184556 [Lentinus brumalis]|uniref:Uncharacterized protein n=1 Tax=Lentinus brumalis TaxID=2498619 RepID=A0A371CU13_9APHY|nr:hypothetical protein OH76DRAFT_1184556 [Polyporus brumalis]
MPVSLVCHSCYSPLRDHFVVPLSSRLKVRGARVDPIYEELQDPRSDDVVGDLSPTQRYLYLVPALRREFKREEYVALLRTSGPVVEAVLCRKETAQGDLQDQPSGNTDDRPETDPCRAGFVVDDLGDRLEWEDWWRQAVAECFPTLSRWRRLYVFPTHGGE